MKFAVEQTGIEVAIKEENKSFIKLPRTRQELILTTALEYERMNQQEKLLKARRDSQLRPIIESAADTFGIPDANENLHLVAPKYDGIDIEIVRTKKTSRTMNTVAAEELLKEKGLYDSCVQMVVTYEIDEEKIIEAYQAGKISAGELNSLFSENITWATSVKTDDVNIKQISNLRKEIENTPKGELKEIESS